MQADAAANVAANTNMSMPRFLKNHTEVLFYNQKQPPEVFYEKRCS